MLRLSWAVTISSYLYIWLSDLQILFFMKKLNHAMFSQCSEMKGFSLFLSNNWLMWKLWYFTSTLEVRSLKNQGIPCSFSWTLKFGCLRPITLRTWHSAQVSMFPPLKICNFLFEMKVLFIPLTEMGNEKNINYFTLSSQLVIFTHCFAIMCGIWQLGCQAHINGSNIHIFSSV